ncbi:MAG: nitrate reductase gamma subunit [Clostridia bacterium]|nr:nitrate reductase subunit gamma [Clostridiales bacterium]MDK2984912.1 nitrate reductase gamma subunit [Clostridia bacterium]
MGIGFSLLIAIVLVLVALLGTSIGLNALFAVVIPYLAFSIFLVGFIARIVKWGRSPVPFRIPTTCGQQKSLDWIKHNEIENPSTKMGVVGRMLLEILCFRSLFRNTRMELREGNKLVFIWEKWLWLAGLLFHWSFFIILFRHLRLFMEPVPSLVELVTTLDGFFGFGMHSLFLTDAFILVAVTYLFIRRVVIPHVKYVSLPADYFPLFLIFGIALSGVLMKYVYRVDMIAVKELTLGLVTFNPVVPQGIGAIFYVHLFLVCVLFMYFPFSKLMHMGGVFLSPTRNLPNDSRAKRHVNPWNYPVKFRTYEEYEDEFRKFMKAMGLPVEKDDSKEKS